MTSIIGDVIHAIFSLFDKPPLTMDELAVKLDAKAAANPERLDWRHSIVDLLKLTGQDSSLDARKRMAKELGYLGSFNGSPAMNIYLHKQVMAELAKRL